MKDFYPYSRDALALDKDIDEDHKEQDSMEQQRKENIGKITADEENNEIQSKKESNKY